MSFLDRWSRLKSEAKKETPARPAETAPAQDLPPVDSLTFDSDFTAYLKANVEESVKRAALKKLLHDPRFNVMDGLDVYIDDYTKNDPIPEEMLKTLEHARSTLFPPGQEEISAETKPAETKPAETAKAPEEAPPPQDNGNPRQDT